MDSAAVIRRRLRRRVADENRKRAARACDRCKARKSKCIATPSGKCQRCLQGLLTCHFDRSESPVGESHESSFASASTAVAVEGQQDVEEVVAPRPASTVVASPCSASAVRSPEETYLNDGHPTERFMWPSFLSRLRETFSLGPPPTTSTQHHHPSEPQAKSSTSAHAARAPQTLSPAETRATRRAAEAFPPRPIADFLLAVCINHATDSFFYFDQANFLAEIDQFYADVSSRTRSDAAFLCLAHACFALGSQWTTLARPPQAAAAPLPAAADNQHGIDHGRIFFAQVQTLLPYVLENSSLCGVSALFVTGVYLLPASSIGSGYIYLGMAMRKALALDLHLDTDDPDVDEKDKEIRRRLWWSIFSLERSTTVKLSRARSIELGLVTAPLPQPNPSMDGGQKFDNVQQQLANARLMVILDQIAEASPSSNPSDREHLAKELKAWKRSLPPSLNFETVDPRSSAYRANFHLCLNYYFSWISMGKVSVVTAVRSHLRHHLGGEASSSSSSPPKDNTTSARIILDPCATTCIKAAIKILVLFESLVRSGNLVRFSFTDFQGCSIATIVVVLAGILERDSFYEGRVTFGLDCLRRMARGNSAAEMGVGFVVALQSIADEAVDKLRRAALGVATAVVVENNSLQQGQAAAAASDYRGWVDWLAEQSHVPENFEESDDRETILRHRESPPPLGSRRCRCRRQRTSNSGL